jgi:hypothetical protein
MQYEVRVGTCGLAKRAVTSSCASEDIYKRGERREGERGGRREKGREGSGHERYITSLAPIQAPWEESTYSVC